MLANLLMLMRPKHYLKNGLIFVPMLFSGLLFQSDVFLTTFLATIAFSLVASAVYVVNDIQDVEKDRKHPKKQFRPIASGKVPINIAALFAAVLLITAAAIGYTINLSTGGWLWLCGYFPINVAYSFGLKNIPIIDVAILASGFVIRILFGAEIIDSEISRWLYLTVLAGAFYLGLGKRRNEISVNGAKSRKVNKFYTHNFLDKNMYVCMALTLVFYSLWATDPASAHGLFWTTPVVILLFMSYSLSIEREGSLGDPVDVITNNRALAVFGVTYLALIAYIIYLS
jgi:4-hydroxybenzoate polyprenyltransferase